MPGRYYIESQVLRLAFDGDTPLQDIAKLLDTALDDPTCPSRPNLLSDLRQSTSVRVRSNEEMKEAVELFVRRGDKLGTRLAVLVQPGLQYGMMRMAEAYSNLKGMQLGVFEDEPAALQWVRGVGQAGSGLPEETS